MLDVASVLRATGAHAVQLLSDGTLRPHALSPADLEHQFSQVSIDSRSVAANGLFIALPGDHADGHDYVEGAFARGARGALVTQLPAVSWQGADGNGPYPKYLFVVPNALGALHQLARFWRGQHAVEVVGVTGSIGKTTTKELVAAVLTAKWPTLRSEANLNTEIGLPLELLRLSPHHHVAVLEMGMYAPGDIALLASIAQPRLGIVTNVAPIHLERLGSIDRIARAKSELVAALPSGGLAILNGDDSWTRAMAQVSGVADSRLVGRAPDCDYRAVDITSHGLDGISFCLHAGGERVALRTRVPGEHTVHAFLAAAAVAHTLGMTWSEVRDAVGEARLAVRQRILQQPSGVLIIDDSYNAAPMSMQAALELLRVSPGEKIAVLGDMLELGVQEEMAHRQVGRCAARIADWLVVRGARAGWIADEAELSGLPPQRVRRVTSNAEVIKVVQEIASRRSEAPAGWAVLVKGSRGMQMEEVVQGLRGEG